jgi:hypothetical protein
MKQRFIRLGKDNTVTVVTIGDKGDGTDNIKEVFNNSYITQTYETTSVVRMGSSIPTLARYDTKEVVFTQSESE